MDCYSTSMDSTSTNLHLVPAAPLSVCAGPTKVALYPGQALNHADAGAFCKQALGPSAGLAPGSPAVLAAAQGLVQQAKVGKPAISMAGIVRQPCHLYQRCRTTV